MATRPEPWGPRPRRAGWLAGAGPRGRLRRAQRLRRRADASRDHHHAPHRTSAPRRERVHGGRDHQRAPPSRSRNPHRPPAPRSRLRDQPPERRQSLGRSGRPTGSTRRPVPARDVRPRPGARRHRARLPLPRGCPDVVSALAAVFDGMGDAALPARPRRPPTPASVLTPDPALRHPHRRGRVGRDVHGDMHRQAVAAGVHHRAFRSGDRGHLRQRGGRGGDAALRGCGGGWRLKPRCRRHRRPLRRGRRVSSRRKPRPPRCCTDTCTRPGKARPAAQHPPSRSRPCCSSRCSCRWPSGRRSRALHPTRRPSCSRRTPAARGRERRGSEERGVHEVGGGGGELHALSGRDPVRAVQVEATARSSCSGAPGSGSRSGGPQPDFSV